jgi:uncharacterized protein YaiI (UPF0178 family)
MKILVDADSCPARTRTIIIKAATQKNIAAIFAANRPIPNLFGTAVMELCPTTDGAADNRITELAEKGDLVVTRDVGLAKRLVEKCVFVMDDRGRIFTSDNTGEQLSIRDFQVGLADAGVEIVRIANYGKKEIKKFSDSFDKALSAMNKNIQT